MAFYRLLFPFGGIFFLPTNICLPNSVCALKIFSALCIEITGEAPTRPSLKNHLCMMYDEHLPGEHKAGDSALLSFRM